MDVVMGWLTMGTWAPLLFDSRCAIRGALRGELANTNGERGCEGMKMSWKKWHKGTLHDIESTSN